MDLPPDFDRLWYEPDNWPFTTEAEPGATMPVLVSAALCLVLLVLALLAPATPLLDGSGIPVGP